MKKAAKPNLKLITSYVDQLKNNWEEINVPKIDTPQCTVVEPTTSTSTEIAKLKQNWHPKVKSIYDMKQCARDYVLNASHHSGIAKWRRFSILNEYMKGFRLGELSILTGPTGSGKTTFLSEYSLDLCLSGVSTLWCSLEVPIGKLIAWMMHQYAKVDYCSLPEETATKRFDDFYEKMKIDLKNMYFFDQHGTVPIDELIKAVEAVHSSQKLDHVLVDNLQFMQGSSKHGSFDKYMNQDLIFSEFRQLASKLNIHVTLVVHPRKEMDGADLHANSLYGGVKASQEADNIFIIQKFVKPWIDPPFTKFLQIHKNRNMGELVLGNTIKMDFDGRTKCHTLRKVVNQQKTSPPYSSNWRQNSGQQQGGGYSANNRFSGFRNNSGDILE